MSEPIKVGDLVVVVKPNRCGCDKGVGTIFRVKTIDKSNVDDWCIWCYATIRAQVKAGNEKAAAQLWRIKRIPPLEELEGVKDEQEITA